VHDAKTVDGSTLIYKVGITDKTVLPEEIRLIQAHLGDILLKVLMQTEEN
jgi:hypothetical protein